MVYRESEDGSVPALVQESWSVAVEEIWNYRTRILRWTLAEYQADLGNWFKPRSSLVLDLLRPHWRTWCHQFHESDPKGSIALGCVEDLFYLGVSWVIPERVKAGATRGARSTNLEKKLRFLRRHLARKHPDTDILTRRINELLSQKDLLADLPGTFTDRLKAMEQANVDGDFKAVTSAANDAFRIYKKAYFLWDGQAQVLKLIPRLSAHLGKTETYRLIRGYQRDLNEAGLRVNDRGLRWYQRMEAQKVKVVRKAKHCIT